ncbi:hypothetical protein [Vreelandella titanicae]|uniref:Uncharacterized protein n=1 Tax=Vreelandella titanicae TaxID=664683 RepID=A0AAP9T2P2_9GAMM|nr:hypothetical protein [Halomonas titanicae]QKS26555.1 hypothetical protein FX987_04364 [Halomonas titanicae]
MSESATVLPVVVELPFTTNYDSATGWLKVRAPMASTDGLQIDYELNLSPEALLTLAYEVRELEKSHETPPSAHRKDQQMQ